MIRDVVQWLRDALSRRGMVEHLTHYRIAEGRMQAANGYIAASHPVDIAGDFLLPGAELTTLLQRMTDPSFAVDGDVVRVREGRLRGTLPILPSTDWTDMAPSPLAWQAVPAGALTAFRTLRPFILAADAARLWSACLGTRGEFYYATNNKVVVRMPGAQGLPSLLIPYWLVDFVLSRQPEPVAWQVNENHVAFRWESDAWVRAQLVEGEFPDKVDTLFEGWKDPATPLTSEDRDALLKALSLAPDRVLFEGGQMRGRSGKMDIDLDVAVPGPPDGRSIWGTENFELVVGAATAWDLSDWPRVGRFVAPGGLQGLMAALAG